MGPASRSFNRIASLVCGCLLGTGVAFGQSASVSTDKPDYVPGEIVVITGTGWMPGETVVLALHEEPTTHEDRTLTAVADADGGFTNSEYSPEPHDVGVTYLLTATGQMSG